MRVVPMELTGWQKVGEAFAKMLSRKFVIAVAYFVVAVILAAIGRSTQDIVEILKALWPAAVYIAGEAVVDAAGRRADPAPPA